VEETHGEIINFSKHTMQTYYSQNRERLLKGVKARQAALDDAYRKANRLQMRRNRQRKRNAGQLSLGILENPLHEARVVASPARRTNKNGLSPRQRGQRGKSNPTETQ
jgi:hypothetical protein